MVVDFFEYNSCVWSEFKLFGIVILYDFMWDVYCVVIFKKVNKRLYVFC